MDETQALQLASEAIKQGDKAAAQRLLGQVIKANPHSETAWLWLSSIVGDPAKEKYCLERVLQINPGNAIAQRHLSMLSQPKTSSPQPTPQITPVSQSPPTPPQTTGEIVFYNDGKVYVTNTRAILSSKTYAMANITSVSQYRKDPNRLIPVLMIIGGALLTLSALVDETLELCGGLGVLMLVVGILWLVTVNTTYHVRIGSASGESNVLGHRDAAYIGKVVEAMNEAIVKRG